MIRGVACQGKRCACGQPATVFEPRFLYFACATHEHLPPVDFGHMAAQMRAQANRRSAQGAEA